MKTKQPLNEINGSLFNKLFYTSCAAWVVGNPVDIKFCGSRQQASVLTEALLSSKRFQEELERSGADLDSVLQKLGDKHAAALKFEETFGMSWPL